MAADYGLIPNNYNIDIKKSNVSWLDSCIKQFIF